MLRRTGRGATDNPVNRFEKIHIEPDADWNPEEVGGRPQGPRRCLEVLAEFRNPVFIITKNRLVTRDIDLLSELARHNAAAVWLSITTLDAVLRKLMEPRTSPPLARLAAIHELAQA